ncbi:MAG: DoxX family membrane protein [Candidatus Liptonbacteria bacterium]|nr:DoxX family membrane protein [Candidatus Liptonbacteria bacterium]
MIHNSQALLIRWGLAFVFLYAGLASLLRPLDWIGYFPPFLLALIPQGFLLPAFAVIEIVLAVWLFSGRRVKAAGWVAFCLLLGITIFNFGIFDVVFRDVGLALGALALTAAHREA